MPTIKTRLSRAEESQHLARANELLAEGVDCEIPEESQESVCGLEIAIGSPRRQTPFANCPMALRAAPSGCACFAWQAI